MFLSVCGENEVYNDDSVLCPPQTCNSIYTSYDCTDAGEIGPGCDCLPGYLRNGTVDDPCIPSEQCPPPYPICAENEEWNYCGTNCPETCENKDKPIICLAICVAGCFCKNGFVKNDDGVCVPPSECKPPVCPVNEEWNTCGSACPPTCDTLNNPVPCVPVCVEGCFCKKGLVRNIDGLCVLPDQCHFPMVISYPHFYTGEPPKDHYVTGLEPDKYKHNSYAIVEPNTGTPFRSVARMQSNLRVHDLSGFFGQYKTFSNSIIPLFWAEYNQEGLPSNIRSIIHFMVVILPPLTITVQVSMILLGSYLILKRMHLCNKLFDESLNTSLPFKRKKVKCLADNKVFVYEKETFIKEPKVEAS